MMRNTILTKRELVLSFENEVHLYNLTTGHVLKRFVAHEGHISCLQLSYGNSAQLYSSSPTENKLKCWDYGDGKLLQSLELAEADWSILRFVVLNKSDIAALVSYKSKYLKVDSNWKIVKLEVRTVKSTKVLKFGRVLLKSKGRPCVDLSGGGPNSSTIAAISNCSLLWFDAKLNEASKRVHGIKLTALAIHPTQVCIATGDAEGKIVLWRRNTCTILHWHAHPVRSLFFPGEGQYLLSGGSEAVLVIWQTSTSKKTFLPRLGAPINSIQSNVVSSDYAVTTSQNTVLLIDAASLRVKFKLGGIALKQPSQSKRALCLDRRSRCIFVAHDGVVDMYSVQNNRIMDSIEVCQRNYIAPTEKEKLTTTTVESIAICNNWLATVERREKEVTLKFWARTSDHGFEIATVCTRAHGDKVNSMNFHRSQRILATGSSDGYFKLWEVKSTRKGWHCRSVNYFRKLPIKGALFSPDGSILAVAESKIICLWEVASNKLKVRLPIPFRAGEVVELQFLGNYTLVALVNNYGIHVYDLRSLKLTISLSLGVQSIATNAETLAVATQHKVVVFNKGEAIPSRVVSLVKPIESMLFAEDGELLCRWTSGKIGYLERASFIEKTTEDESLVAQANGSIQQDSKSKETESLALEGENQLERSQFSYDLNKSLALYSSHLLPSVKSISERLHGLQGNKKQPDGRNLKRKLVLSNKTIPPKKERTISREKVSSNLDWASISEAQDRLTKFFKTIRTK